MTRDSEWRSTTDQLKPRVKTRIGLFGKLGHSKAIAYAGESGKSCE